MTTFYQVTKEAPKHGIHVKDSRAGRCYEFMIANVDLSIASMMRYGKQWRGDFGAEKMVGGKGKVATWLLQKSADYLRDTESRPVNV